MKMSLRQMFAPTLLALALAPLAFSAQAEQHSGHASEADREAFHQRMEERRQEVYERAGLNEEQQAALNEVNAEHYQAMQALRAEHQEKVADILSEEERDALKDAMKEVHDEHRGEGKGHGRRGGHDHRDGEAEAVSE
ncbi:hypothetical protein B0H98_101734 [Vreelandella songnenensis]|uniref:Zinc resistance-associated protein n=1 Tax=Vreelandella songnenensis TaxID=1176243 RepID=A0A2T0V969_9GAMM|nr:hypothetical protein [Halomonas songnenensis]PRY66739.1 hypothetical protein B0H98_101734 [Halomonas songnenensis]